MVHAVRLTRFRLVLPVAACCALGFVGSVSVRAGSASDAPIGSRAVGVGLVLAWITRLLRVTIRLAGIQLVFAGWTLLTTHGIRINRKPPNRNNTTIDNIPVLALPVYSVIQPTNIGPITAANFPSIL